MPSSLKDVWAKMPWRKAPEPVAPKASPELDAETLNAKSLQALRRFSTPAPMPEPQVAEVAAVLPDEPVAAYHLENLSHYSLVPMEVVPVTNTAIPAALPAAEPIPAPFAEPQEFHMSFLSKFKLEFEKLFHETPSWIHTGESVVAFAAPVVLAIIAQFDPAVALVAAPIVAEIKADLSTVAVLVGDGTATPSLTAALNSIKSNLGALLTAGHIKDAKIQADVTLVVSEIAALVGELPIASAPAAVPVAAPAAK